MVGRIVVARVQGGQTGSWAFTTSAELVVWMHDEDLSELTREAIGVQADSA